MTSESVSADALTFETFERPARHRASELDTKLLQHFPGLVVRKDLTNGLKQNAVVPTYVLEYLLGQHCARLSSDSTS